MPIKLDCPRCKRPLSVPSKKTGSYVNCPDCRGRFWVPEDSSADAPRADAAVSPSGAPTEAPAAPPVQTPPASANSPNSSSTLSGAGEPSAPAADQTANGPPPPPAPAAERKTARFISPEVAQSTLQVAEDGQLPELQLQEHEQKKKKTEPRTTTINPLVLFGVISLSVVLSILLVLYEAPEPPESEQVKTARTTIEGCWSNAESTDPLKPYQIYLREAHVAHTRGDYKTERKLYRQVYGLLKVEGEAVITNIDHEIILEEFIPVMLNDR